MSKSSESTLEAWVDEVDSVALQAVELGGPERRFGYWCRFKLLVRHRNTNVSVPEQQTQHQPTTTTCSVILRLSGRTYGNPRPRLEDDGSYFTHRDIAALLSFFVPSAWQKGDFPKRSAESVSPRSSSASDREFLGSAVPSGQLSWPCITNVQLRCITLEGRTIKQRLQYWRVAILKCFQLQVQVQVQASASVHLTYPFASIELRHSKAVHLNSRHPIVENFNSQSQGA